MESIFNAVTAPEGIATEQAFKTMAGGFALLHLTTHSLLNEDQPEATCLILDPDTSGLEDGLLHNYELYNMNLTAQLAVLSACNTGIGKLQQGEGVMSLAHAFTYAGCPSVLMSLWQVNDFSTASIVGSFYEQLADGKPKDVALRAAKLRYLEETDPLKAAPYFWAGMVSIGEQSPLKRSSSLPFLWAALGLLVVVGGWFWWKRSQS